MAKPNDTDPMNAPLPVQRTTQPMLTAPAPQAPSSSDDLTATTETPLTDLVSNMTEKDCSPAPVSKPVLSKDEIRSMFRDLSEGLGDPTRRAAPPDSEVAQYAQPHPLRSRNKTPVLEPAIVVRNSVLEGALATSSRNINPPSSPDARGPWPAKTTRPVRTAAKTVQTRPFVKTKRARVGAVLFGVVLVLGVTGMLLWLPTQGPAPVQTANAGAAATTVTQAKAKQPVLAPLALKDAAPQSAPSSAPSAAVAGAEPSTPRPELAARTTSPTPPAPATTVRPRALPAQPSSITTSDPPVPGTALPYSHFTQERK